MDVIHPSAIGHIRLADILVKEIDYYKYAKLVSETEKTINDKDAIINQKNGELAGKNDTISDMDTEITKLTANANDSKKYGDLMMIVAIIAAALLIIGGTGIAYFIRKRKYNRSSI